MGLDFYGVTLKKVSDRDRFDEGRNPVHLPSHDTTPCFFGCLRFIMQKNLLQAIDLALAGQWDAAHGISTQALMYVWKLRRCEASGARHPSLGQPRRC
jgi:hypothetical protein